MASATPWRGWRRRWDIPRSFDTTEIFFCRLLRAAPVKWKINSGLEASETHQGDGLDIEGKFVPTCSGDGGIINNNPYAGRHWPDRHLMNHVQGTAVTAYLNKFRGLT